MLSLYDLRVWGKWARSFSSHTGEVTILRYFRNEFHFEGRTTDHGFTRFLQIWQQPSKRQVFLQLCKTSYSMWMCTYTLPVGLPTGLSAAHSLDNTSGLQHISMNLFIFPERFYWRAKIYHECVRHILNKSQKAGWAQAFLFLLHEYSCHWSATSHFRHPSFPIIWAMEPLLP